MGTTPIPELFNNAANQFDFCQIRLDARTPLAVSGIVSIMTHLLIFSLSDHQNGQFVPAGKPFILFPETRALLRVAALLMQKILPFQSRFKRYGLPLLALLTGLALTACISYAVKARIIQEAQREFNLICEEARQAIDAVLQAHKQILLGGAALFDASQSVQRQEWHAYAKRLQIDQHFNGIQGLGFALSIPKEQLSSHVNEIRQQGFPAYRVHPAYARDVYSAIIYLEPFSGLNLRAFGYDMYAQPVRQAAMAQARDENQVTLTGKVQLVQEVGQDIQAGTLMYVPVYRKAMPLKSVAQRQQALKGWVYSPFRMTDLLHHVLQSTQSLGGEHIVLKVYDGHSVNADDLLYSSLKKASAMTGAPTLFRLETQMDFNGRVWTLDFGTRSPHYPTDFIVLSGFVQKQVRIDSNAN